MPTQQAKVKSSDQSSQEALTRAYEAYVAKLREQKKITDEQSTSFVEKARAGEPVLTFDTKEAANEFFTEQAKTGSKFVGVYEDGKGNPTGEYNISDGDGKLYQGKFSPSTIQDLKGSWAEIQSNPELKSQVVDALKTQDEAKLKGVLAQLKAPTATASTLGPLPDRAAAPAIQDKASTAAAPPHLTDAPDSAPAEDMDDKPRLS
jgi:hypothetical protein